MSTNLGLKLLIITELISETQVKLGTIIFFFFDKIFKIFIDKIFAELPEFTKTLYFTPSHLDHSFSNFFTNLD